MMYHHLIDQHPGRCPNYRNANHATLRCLRMEGHNGPCRFDEPPSIDATFTSGVYQQQEPKPWVEPPES